MRQFKVPGSRPVNPGPSGLSKSEKRKLIALTVGVLLVGYSMYIGYLKGETFRSKEGGDLPVEEALVEKEVSVPEVGGTRIDELVRDGDQLERVTIEGEGLDLVLGTARALTPGHFEAMKAEELSQESIAGLLETPSPNRGKAFFARGRVDALRTRRRSPELPEEHIGRLILDDGSVAYFLVMEIPEDPLYVRVDGLFLKNYSDELYEKPGEWVDGPLLIGPRAIRSFESLGTVEGFDWAALYQIEDAKLNEDPPRIVRDTPYAAMWHLMAMVRDLPEGAIDWASAPELSAELLTELNEDPDTWRWQPIRIPISRVQDARIKRAGENPARIDRYTQGWIGNAMWNNVIHFRSPDLYEDFEIGDYFRGQGFFLHNFAYDAKARNLHTAPLFVLHSVEEFVPKEDETLVYIAWGAAGGTVLLVGLFIFLLFRDRKKARALQEEIIRRRRARRARQDGTPPPGGPITATTS